MAHSRAVGLLLILLGVATLVGHTIDWLPSEAFFGGLLLYPIGAAIFVSGSRRARERADRRTARALRPRIANEQAERYADQQAANLSANEHATLASASAPLSRARQLTTEEIVLYEVDDDGALQLEDDFKVSTDVSFPLEIQEQTGLAEQLERLRTLRDEEIISEREFETAKAKLLG